MEARGALELNGRCRKTNAMWSLWREERSLGKMKGASRTSEEAREVAMVVF